MKMHFRALENRNYRLWAGGSLVSYIGTWMQRVAQSWLVLTVLTQNDVAQVGIVTGLQYAPIILLLPWTGHVADRFDRRRLLLVTQALMAVLSFVLGLMILTKVIVLWHVYVFAVVFGAVTAFDTPASHALAGDLVGEETLSNAVALNATAFNSARLIGPGVAGLLIGLLGIGWAFVLNATSFLAVLAALLTMRSEQFHMSAQSTEQRGILGGFQYTLRHPQLRSALVMLFLVGTFALNFPLFISAVAVKVFHASAGGYGLLMSIMGVGSVAGALVAAGAHHPGMRHLGAGSLFLTTGFVAAALAPSYWLFAAALVVIGGAAVTFTTSTNSFMQLESDPSVRGRVIALRVAVAIGGTPLGGPVLGWIAQTWGPRWVLGAAAVASLGATLAALPHMRGRPANRL